ncbi:MAG: phosphoribosyltransferase family protein [Ruminococcus callidus]
MAAYYTLHIAGLTRELKICPISEKLDIAAFILFSDVELTEACARELAKRVPECDYILTAESKGIPLAYEMSRQLKVPYIVARKSVKGYMTDVLSVQVKSITTAAVQTLYLDGEKAAWMKGKRVLIVDDVISTGDSPCAAAAGEICRRRDRGQCGALAEGDAAERKDLIYLEQLPLFFKD